MAKPSVQETSTGSDAFAVGSWTQPEALSQPSSVQQSESSELIGVTLLPGRQSSVYPRGVPRLVTCPHCHVHVKLLELRCPHCEALLPLRFGTTTSALLLGLSLGRCGEAGMAVEYGVAEHEPPSLEDEKKAPSQKQVDVKKVDDRKDIEPLPTPDPEYGMPDPGQALAPEYGMPEPADESPPTR